jgi:hypothetical protein
MITNCHIDSNRVFVVPNRQHAVSDWHKDIELEEEGSRSQFHQWEVVPAPGNRAWRAA